MPFFRMPDVFYTKPVEPTYRAKYGKKPMQTITVRIPDGDGPFPTLITLHGGKWRAEYRAKQLEYLCTDLAQHGIACCNLEYKRLGHINGGYPGTFIDLLDGIQYILDHAEEWELDTSRISLLGHSSGAHLAFCLCGYSDFEGRKLPLTPHATIGIAGVYDLQNYSKLQHEIDQFFKDHPILSPIHMLPLGIKQLVICGSKDKLVEQALNYVERAQETDNITLEIIDKASHFTVIDPTFSGWPQVRNAILEIT